MPVLAHPPPDLQTPGRVTARHPHAAAVNGFPPVAICPTVPWTEGNVGGAPAPGGVRRGREGPSAAPLLSSLQSSGNEGHGEDTAAVVGGGAYEQVSFSGNTVGRHP